MAWKIEGTYFESCNCSFACPCSVTSFGAPATQDRCRVILNYHIQNGKIDGVDVSGHNVSLVADAPAKMLDGGWQLGLIIDDKASKEQMDKLAGVFSGAMGGPMAGLAPLVGKVLGVEQQPIEFHEKGGHHGVKIGSDIHVEVDDYTPEGLTEPTQLVNVFHPSNTTLTVARPAEGHIKAFGLEFETSGRSAFSAPFRWSA
ncbi:MAG TPA: DUF1326 domain-containing protein [Candidatus Dormibacteraeota bacterium]|jgi:hypothetical protein